MPKVSPQAIEAHVRFLADDLLEGRRLGTRGHELAARYVAAQFATIGLQPGGTEGYFQRITFERRSFAGARETMTLERGGKSSVFVNGVDLRVGPGTVAGPESISAGLVFAGFGIESKIASINDYAGLDVTGKIVVVIGGAPLGMDSEIGASLNASKAEVAARHGAIGLISVRTLADIARRPWSKVAGSARQPVFSWEGPDGKPNASAAALRFNAAVDEAAGDQLFAGAPRTLADIRAEVGASPTARPKGFALAGTLRLDRATAIDRVTSPNVVGVLPGTTPVLRDEFVLLTAHADHLGIRPELPGDKIYNGAADNASGVALLLEAARSFAESPRRTGRSLMFIVTTGEEVGLQGADYFAHNPTVAIGRIASEVDLDMPILTCSFGEIVPYGAAHSTMGETVAKVARSMGIGIAPDPQPIEGIFTRSDHYRLVQAGVPALFLKTGPGDDKGGKACGVADKAFRATQYHEPSDDMSLPFNWVAAARFADFNIRLTRALADAKARPLWYRGDFFGDTFAPGQPRAERAAR